TSSSASLPYTTRFRSPAANYYGTDAFTYQATDGTNLSALATVTITIAAVDDTPTATDDAISTTEDNPVSGNVLTNDTDVDSGTRSEEHTSELHSRAHL